MKWGTKKFRFARPLRWILALADTKVISFEIEGISSGNVSKGHRFFGNSEFTVDSISDKFITFLNINDSFIKCSR